MCMEAAIQNNDVIGGVLWEEKAGGDGETKVDEVQNVGIPEKWCM